MYKSAGQMSAAQTLYPPIEPFDQRVIDVGDGHSVYFEQCGNPDGIPVLVCHGGPGGGCSPAMRRYFDPEIYRVILFDQRGCGRSTPHANAEYNTIWHLVADMEKIRELLGIDIWLLFGGSWGATLALVYAQTHAEHVRHLVLRGVFLMTQRELDWFYGGGAGQFWPELWERFKAMIPAEERGDLIRAYHKRLFSGTHHEEIRFARAWSAWETALASIDSIGSSAYSGSGEYARAFARLENHYFINGGFLDDGQQILSNMDRLSNVSGTIIQGRYDLICPPRSAYDLSRLWKKSELRMVSKAGHAMSDPGITSELVRTMNMLPLRFGW